MINKIVTSIKNNLKKIIIGGIFCIFLWWAITTQIFNIGGTLHYYLKDGQSLVLNINKDAKSDLQIFNKDKATDKYNIDKAKLRFTTDYYGGQFLSDEKSNYYYINEKKVFHNNFLSNFFYTPTGKLYYDYDNNYLVYNDFIIPTSGPVYNAFLLDNLIYFATIASPNTYFTYNLDTNTVTNNDVDFTISKLFTYNNQVYLLSEKELYRLDETNLIKIPSAETYLAEGEITNISIFKDSSSFIVQTDNEAQIYKLVDNTIKKIASYPNNPKDNIQVYEQFYSQRRDQNLYIYDVINEKLYTYSGTGLYFDYNSYVLDSNNNDIDKVFYEEPYPLKKA